MSEQNPYAPPRAETKPSPPPEARLGEWEGPRAWADGPNLAIALGSEIAPVCLKCARTDDLVRRPQKFSWMPPEKKRNRVIAGALFGAAGGLAIEAVNAKHRKNAELSLPLCSVCDERWNASKRLALLSLIGFFGSFVFILFAMNEHLVGPLGLLLLLFATIAVLALVSRAVVFPRQIGVDRIEESFIVINRVDARAIDEIVKRAAKKKKKKRATPDDLP